MYCDSIMSKLRAICLIVTVSTISESANNKPADFGTPTLPRDGSNGQRRDTTVHIRRWHTHNGFHRDLSTEIEVKALRPSSYKDCVFLMIETLHSGVYVDLDQLLELAEWGGPQVLSETTIDVETPEYASPEHTVYVYFGGGAEGGVLRARVTLPVHLRYHRPSDLRPSAEVILRRPRVLARCTDASTSGLGVEILAPCRHTNDSICSWTDLSYDIKDGALLALGVPVGIKGHTTVVAVGTILLTTLGALSILRAMFENPDHTKQE